MTWDEFMTTATKEERQKVAKTMSPESLLEAFRRAKFDMCDFEGEKPYEILKAEILSRLNELENIIKIVRLNN